MPALPNSSRDLAGKVADVSAHLMAVESILLAGEDTGDSASVSHAIACSVMCLEVMHDRLDAVEAALTAAANGRPAA